MMRASFLSLLLAGLGVACAQPSAEPAADPTIRDTGSDAKSDTPSLVEARRLMQQGQLDEAMIVADAILKVRPADRDARLFRAQGSIAIFESGRQPGQVFLQDAVRDLEAILGDSPGDADALTALAHCRLRLGEFDASRDAALRAAETLTANNAQFEKVSNALLQAADAEMQIFVDVRRQELADGVERPGDDSTAAANRVLALLKSVEQRGPVPQARVRTAQVCQWMNRGLQALEELESGLRALPESNEMHQAFQQAFWSADMRKECVAAYKGLLRESPGSGAMRWYLGRAQVALGDDLRRKTDWTNAAKAYADALETFRAYDAERRSERAATSQWIAICELSLGRLEYERGNFDAAREHYEAAYDATPLVAEYDDSGLPRVYDSFGGNYLGGLSLIGQALAEKSDEQALRDSLAFYERVLERHPGRFGSVYNNAALSARDLGVQIARGSEDGAREEAMREALALWEKSYRYYERAVELAPEDARIMNDCGLMLVYHLHRDYDRARELFDTAIEVGDAELAAIPEDAPAEQRQSLEEAVGDAWQNIGVLLAQNLSKPFAEAEPFLKKSLEYYPYERREAARMLRRMQGQSAPQGALKAKFENAVRPARQHAEQKDFDSALLIMDQLAKDDELSQYPPFRYLYGSWSFAFAESAAQEGKDVGLVDGLFQDAVRHLQRAVELDGEPVEPRLALVRALLATGRSEDAARGATDLLSHIRSRGGVDAEVVQQVHALRAEAAARAFVAKKQAGEEGEELLRDARASFREIEQTPAFDDAKRSLWIMTERWAGADEQAIQIAIRAWQREPEQRIAELVELGSQTATSDEVIRALAGADDATTLWWNARAHFDHARQIRADGEASDAAKALDEAVALFERSMAQNAAFAESCEQWAALCLGQKSLVLAGAGETAAAEEAVIEALDRRPDVFENDLGGGASIKRAVLVVGDRYFRNNELGKVAEFYRKVGARVPRDVDVANNEGLFCRDWATALESRGQQDAAREFYEASYAAYTRAAELDPTNVRLMNDRALLLIYHLGRDLDTAVELLEKAIRLGEERLASDPPTESRELRDLQEAVGDAYGNLGTYHLRYTEDLAAARRNIEKSLEFYPYAQRAGTRELQRIERMEREKQGESSDGDDR